MIQDLKILKKLISEINEKLKVAYITPIDEDNIQKIRIDIVNLLEKSISYIKASSLVMNPWQKEHIVDAINALYWDWLHWALSSISLTIEDMANVSPEIKYRDEIINLNDDDLILNINKVKKYIDDKNKTAF